MSNEQHTSVVEWVKDKLEKGEVDEEIVIKVSSKPRLGMSSMATKVGDYLEEVRDEKEKNIPIKERR